MEADCKDELKEMNDQRDKSMAAFLEFVFKKYTSYTNNQQIKFKPEDFEDSKLSKTVKKATLHYSVDKQNTMPNHEELFTKKDRYLRKVIMQHLTKYINESKGLDK